MRTHRRHTNGIVRALRTPAQRTTELRLTVCFSKSVTFRVLLLPVPKVTLILHDSVVPGACMVSDRAVRFPPRSSLLHRVSVSCPTLSGTRYKAPLAQPSGTDSAPRWCRAHGRLRQGLKVCAALSWSPASSRVGYMLSPPCGPLSHRWSHPAGQENTVTSARLAAVCPHCCSLHPGTWQRGLELSLFCVSASEHWR